MEGWLGPGVGLEFWGRQIFFPAWTRTPQHPARSLVTLGLQNNLELVYVQFSKFRSWILEALKIQPTHHSPQGSCKLILTNLNLVLRD